MIKRALGFFDGGRGGKKDAEEEDDSDDGLTDRQRSKLERRLLPGAHGKAQRFGAGPTLHSDEEDDEEDDDDQLEGEEEEEEGSESDDEPLMPPEEEKPFRGQFRCELCPDKILMNEKLMEAHLQSAGHRKNVRRFERAKEMGVDAFEEECRARAAAREAAASSGQASRRQRKNEAFWAKRREKSKKKSGSEKAKELTATQIEDKKQKFQAKKAQRALRKQDAADDGPKGEPGTDPSCAREGDGGTESAVK